MYRVLIADDKKIEQDYLLDYLTQNYPEDFSVLGLAKDGQEVLDLVKTEEIDLLLLDIQMPKLDGLEVAEQLRKSHSNIVIVLITAYAEFSYAKQAIKLGVSDYLLKPYLDEELKEALGHVMEKLDQEKKNDKKKSEKHHPLSVQYFQQKNALNKVTLDKEEYFYQLEFFQNQYVLGSRYKAVVLFGHSFLEQSLEALKMVEDIFRKKNLYVIGDVEGSEIILFLFGKSVSDFNELDESIKRVRKYYQEGYQQDVICGVSGFHDNLEDLGKTYLEAVSFVSEFGTTEIKMAYEENKRLRRDMFEKERAILIHLLNKKENLAIQELDELIEETLISKTSSLAFIFFRLTYLGYALTIKVYGILDRESEGRERIAHLFREMENASEDTQKQKDIPTKLIFELMQILGQFNIYNNVLIVKEAKKYV